MRQRNMMTGFDMEQNSQSFFHHPDIIPNFPHPPIPPVNTVPNSEAHSLQDRSSSMFYGLPQYHHQPASPNFYPPYVPAFHPPPPSHMLSPGSHGAVVGVTSTEHERNSHFMDHGYKRKSAEVIPGNCHYPSNAAAAPCSYPQLNTPETAPFSYSQFGTYPQPFDQRNVRNRAGAATMDPLPSHGHNNFIQGNYAAPPFPPPGSTWYDQQRNGSRSDGSYSLWSQAPSVPYMPGNVVDSGNVCFPRYHETPSGRNPTPFVDPRHHYISHQPVPPPATVYHHTASASYTVPEGMYDASYTHVGPVQSTGFRIHQQYPQDSFAPAPVFRQLHGIRAMATDEGDFYNFGNYVDHHQDMRLDIEGMSYEELLDLSEQIGTVKTGLSEKDVKNQLKRRTCLLTRSINLEEPPSTDLETDSCSICQENYESQDKIATLDCRHSYHAECLKKWLVLKNVCPICKSEALVMEKKKKARLSIGEEVAADST